VGWFLEERTLDGVGRGEREGDLTSVCNEMWRVTGTNEERGECGDVQLFVVVWVTRGV
jgi:hypothetical protein